MSNEYTITRDCCTSGNCVNTCWDKTPFGVKVRVIQCSTNDKSFAMKVVNGWRDYNAKIERLK